jgi:NAD-dependent deacetylase
MILSVKTLRKWIDESQNIVFFGGAGTSTESNIPDFRTAGGLYEKKQDKYPYSPETIISHSFFRKHPRMFYDYYKENLLYPNAQPNDAHKALAELEKRGKLSAVITQNIDGLHQLAGHKEVIELHGSVHVNYCESCGAVYNLKAFLNLGGSVPACVKCGGQVRPDVVLYEEGLKTSVIEKAIQAIALADMLIIGGTSLVVYPAAGLVNYFKGNKLVLINKADTQVSGKADLVFKDAIGKVLREAVYTEAY